MIADKSDVLTIDMVLSNRIDLVSKKSNYFYKVIDGTDRSVDMNELWSKLTLYKRESSKATAYRYVTNDYIFKRLCEEYSEDYDKTLKRLTNLPEMETAEFIDMVRRDPLMYDFLAMEHRRWCYFTVTIGWSYGEVKDEKYKHTPCLIGQDGLMENEPDYVQYDLLPLMAIAGDDLCS